MIFPLPLSGTRHRFPPEESGQIGSALILDWFQLLEAAHLALSWIVLGFVGTYALRLSVGVLVLGSDLKGASSAILLAQGTILEVETINLHPVQTSGAGLAQVSRF